MRSYRAYVLMSISCVLFLISISIMAADYDPAITLIESKYKIKDMTIQERATYQFEFIFPSLPRKHL